MTFWNHESSYSRPLKSEYGIKWALRSIECSFLRFQTYHLATFGFLTRWQCWACLRNDEGTRRIDWLTRARPVRTFWVPIGIKYSAFSRGSLTCSMNSTIPQTLGYSAIPPVTITFSGIILIYGAAKALKWIWTSFFTQSTLHDIPGPPPQSWVKGDLYSCTYFLVFTRNFQAIWVSFSMQRDWSSIRT